MTIAEARYASYMTNYISFSEDNKNCSDQFFPCASGRCVPMDWRCDGDDDCGDLSDENSCPEQPCLQSEFRCRVGTCIPGRWRCDGLFDCPDSSDEVDCCTYVSIRYYNLNPAFKMGNTLGIS